MGKEAEGRKNIKEKASVRKLDSEKLKQFLAKHPDAYLREIAVTYACRRLKITRKKDHTL